MNTAQDLRFELVLICLLLGQIVSWLTPWLWYTDVLTYMSTFASAGLAMSILHKRPEDS